MHNCPDCGQPLQSKCPTCGQPVEKETVTLPWTLWPVMFGMSMVATSLTIQEDAIFWPGVVIFAIGAAFFLGCVDEWWPSREERRRESTNNSNPGLGDEGGESMTEQDVVNLMKSSKDENEWNENCDKVKVAFGGYPSFWWSAIKTSGLADETRACWKS